MLAFASEVEWLVCDVEKLGRVNVSITHGPRYSIDPLLSEIK